MPISTLFLNLSQHHLSLEFSETILDDGMFWELVQLDFSESGLKVKKILESVYLDGITGLEDVKVDGKNITGIFLDYVSPSLTRRYTFTITPNDVIYQMVNTGQEAQFSEYLEYAKVAVPKVAKTGAKSKATKSGKTRQCTEGKSHPCGASCISISKKCRQPLLDSLKELQQKIVQSFNQIVNPKSGDKQEFPTTLKISPSLENKSLNKEEPKEVSKSKQEDKIPSKATIDIKEQAPAQKDQKRQKNITQEFSQEWINTFEKAPDDLNQIIIKIASPDQIVGRNDNFNLKTKIAFYDTKEQAIYTGDLTPKSLIGSSAFRHEYGHHIDYELGKKVGVSQISATNSVNSKFRLDEKSLLDRENKVKQGNTEAFKELENYKEVPSVKKLLDGKDTFSEENKSKVGAEIKRVKILNDIRASLQDKGNLSPEAKTDEIIKILEDKIKAGSLELTRTYKNIQGITDSKDKVNLLVKYLVNPESVTVEFESSEKFLESRGVGTRGILSDLVGSMTRNKIGYGHSEEYYAKKKDRQNSETFANLVSLYGSGDKEAIAILESLVPESLKVVKQVFKHFSNKL